MNKIRFATIITSFILVVLTAFLLITELEWVIDSLEGDYGTSRQIEAITFTLFNICLLIAVIINITKLKSKGKGQFITLSCFYGAGVVLGFYSFMAGYSDSVFIFAIGLLLCFILFLYFIINTIKYKNPLVI